MSDNNNLFQHLETGLYVKYFSSNNSWGIYRTSFDGYITSVLDIDDLLTFFDGYKANRKL